MLGNTGQSVRPFNSAAVAGRPPKIICKKVAVSQ